MTEVTGRAAVVTGAGSGIGKGLALALAREGCKVGVVDIMLGNAEAVTREIEQAGGQAVALACDVSDRTSVAAMKRQANARLGPVSLLFANAGVTLFKPLVEMTDDEIDWVIEVDLMGVFHCLKAFIPDMIAARDGHIMATSSFAGLLSAFIPDHAPYIAAKAGVIGLMLSMGRELAEFGIKSTVLCPGAVETGIANSFLRRPARFGGPVEASVHLPAGKAQSHNRTPDEVAQMVLRAVRADRPVVVTHASAKDAFKQCTDIILSAFDDAAEFDAR